MMKQAGKLDESTTKLIDISDELQKITQEYVSKLTNLALDNDMDPVEVVNTTIFALKGTKDSMILKATLERMLSDIKAKSKSKGE